MELQSTAVSRKRDESDKRKRRMAFVKFGLAGVALLGIGAAVTSAAWTDQAWFSADATAATIELQGGDGTTAFTNADTNDAAIAIPAATFKDLIPAETRTYEIKIKNTSTVDLKVAAPTVTKVEPSTGDSLWAAGSTVTVTTDFGASPVTLTPGTTKTVTVTVTSGALPEAFQGTTGSVTLTFTGTTV